MKINPSRGNALYTQPALFQLFTSTMSSSPYCGTKTYYACITKVMQDLLECVPNTK